LARLLLDTHVLIWVPTGEPRVSERARDALADGAAELFVSAVNAYELVAVQRRGTVAMTESIADIAGPMGFSVLDLPADIWRIAAGLPDIHRDPIDRMMIAHALHDDLTIVTADKKIRRYPVKTLW
jgi:PIN domain nuclease of toxin-antitoxin system